jgi:hypothetical protein
MISLINQIWDYIKRLFVLAFPMLVATAPDQASGDWPARVLLVTTVLFGLGLLNRWPFLGLSNVSSTPEPINRIWVPLLALVLYAGLWVLWWLWALINSRVETVSEFADIDGAWRKASEALSKAGIPLESTPLYLILGSPSSTEEALFRASGIKAQVNQAPRDPGEPLHVTANREGVWITCPGVSLMGRQEAEAGPEVVDDPFDVGGGDCLGAADPHKTMGVDDGTLRVEDLVKKIVAQGAPKGRPAAKTTAEIENGKARLAYLCRLIVRDRRGFCPVNGVLLLLPIAAADLDDLARYCKIDLAVVFETFPMRCPVLALVCGLELLPGFAEVLERLPSGQGTSRMRRMGQRFPLVPELPVDKRAAAIEDAVDWVAETVLPKLIYSLFRHEMPGGEDVEDAVQGNAQLFRFLSEIHKRQEQLSRIVSSCLPTTLDEPLFFGGCYFAATGTDPATQQSFTSGVFRRLLEDQDLVTWTAEARNADARDERLAHLLRNVFTVLLVLGALILAALIAWKAFLGGSTS